MISQFFCGFFYFPGDIKKQLERLENKVLLKVGQLQTTLLALVNSNNYQTSYNSKFKFSVPGRDRGLLF